MEILRDWQRLEACLKKHAPFLLDTLNGGAHPEQIAAAEKALSVSLPEEMRALYRLHDGQKSRDDSFLGGVTWLSLENILGEWKIWKELLDSRTFEGTQSDPDPGIRNDWWHPAWIPFTYNGAGDHLCVDLAPAPQGRLGQIITMWHDEGMRNIEAPSFGAWIRMYADGMESGACVYSEDYGGIVKKEDA
jgi:cell wall assembly regulator SMI1